jgi:disulfide bond formation protein DsbB
MTERQTTFARVALVVVLLAMLGSLYFSEIAGYPPCKLCWLQRIAIYPLSVILAVALIRRDGLAHLYVLPLVVFGLLVSAYHNLLYYGIIPDSLAPCELGVSCTTKFIEWFGFVTIPLLSLAALATVAALMVIFRNEGRKA